MYKQDRIVEVETHYTPEMLHEALCLIEEVTGFLAGPQTHVEERMATQNDLMGKCGDILIRTGRL